MCLGRLSSVFVSRNVSSGVHVIHVTVPVMVPLSSSLHCQQQPQHQGRILRAAWAPPAEPASQVGSGEQCVQEALAGAALPVPPVTTGTDLPGRPQFPLLCDSGNAPFQRCVEDAV